MQPRHRSKCSTTVGLSEIVPSRCDSISWIRPRGESISSFQSRYVGHVGRQKPQWTQSLVSERSTSGAVVMPAPRPGRSARAPAPAGAAPARASQRRRRRGGRRCRPRGGRRRSGFDRGTPAARPARTTSARAPSPWSERDSAQTAPSVSSPPTSARVAATCAATAAAPPSNSTATRPGWRMSTALGTSWEASSAAVTDAASAVSTTTVAARHGIGMEAEADPADEGEPATRAADELAEVVAGDVLDDLAAGVDDRAVGEHERDAEHEVARGAEPVAQRAREILREAGADRRVARRVEREPLPGRGERGREGREADAGFDGAGEVARLVLEDAVHARGVEIGADPDRPPLGRRGRRARRTPARG